MILFFFFFKQKTAYEMRISDWSSDVCSSDLAAPLSRTADGMDGMPPAARAFSSENASVDCDEVVAAGMPGGVVVCAPAALAMDAATMTAAIVRYMDDNSLRTGFAPRGNAHRGHRIVDRKSGVYGKRGS